MKSLQAAAFVCFAATLAACGGGGGTSPMPTASPISSPTASPTPAPVPTLATATYLLPFNENPLTGPIVGPDHNLWFVAETSTNGGINSGVFVKFTSASQVTYPIPGPTNAAGASITVGPDGAIWSTVTNNVLIPNSLVARVDASGNVTTYALPATDAFAGGLTVGSDGNLWYVASAIDPQGDCALRAFSPTSHTIVASLVLPSSLHVLGPMVSNPVDGTLLISTSKPAGFLKIKPSSSPTVNATYQTPYTNENIAHATSSGGTLYAIASEGNSGYGGSAHLIALNESTYAIAYAALPQYVSCDSPCVSGEALVTAPMAVGPDDNIYAYTLGVSGGGDPHGGADFLGVTPSGSAIAVADAYSLGDESANVLYGTVLGADGNIWSTAFTLSGSVVYEFTPLHASRVRGWRRL